MRVKFQGRLRIFCALLIFILLSAVSAGQASCREQTGQDVALLPFTFHGPEDLTYLKSGVRDMIASRIASIENVRVIEKGKVDQILGAGDEDGSGMNFTALGSKLEADYLIAGSITVVGRGVSLDAKVYPLSEKQLGKAMAFFTTAASEDSIIGAISELAWKIRDGVFGKYPAESAGEIPGAETEPVPQGAETAHPDRAYVPPPPAVAPPPVSGQPLTPVPAAPEAGARAAEREQVDSGDKGPLTSEHFDITLRALDVGDVNGDGDREMVLAERDKLYILKEEKNSYSIFGEIEGRSRYAIHAVNLADLNNNGRMEIYVSASDAEGPGSYALEWDGSDFVYLFRDVAWFIRPLETADDIVVLAGQRGASDKVLFPGIYALQHENDTLVEKEKLAVPEEVNLFDFVIVDLDNDRQDEIVAIDQENRLKIYAANGNVAWVSNERYGGTEKFVGGEPFDRNDLDDSKTYRIYVPARIIVADINTDGFADLVVGRNTDGIDSMFKRYRDFDEGAVTALTWDGKNLVSIWDSGNRNGYIPDYQLIRTGDALFNLYIGQIIEISRGGWLSKLTREQTVIRKYRLTPSIPDKE